MFLSLSSEVYPAANEVDLLPSYNRRIQIKIWFGDGVLVTDSISILWPLELLRV